MQCNEEAEIMNKIKNFISITGVVVAFMGTLCATINAGVDSVEKIKSIKEVK